MVRPQILFLPLPEKYLWLDFTLSAVKILESFGTLGKNKQEGPQTQHHCYHFINNVIHNSIAKCSHLLI